MERIVRQKRMVEIFRPSVYEDLGMGFRGYAYPQNTYYKGEYTSPEDIAKRVAEATVDTEAFYKDKWCERKPIEVLEWWENIEILSQGAE